MRSIVAPLGRLSLASLAAGLLAWTAGCSSASSGGDSAPRPTYPSADTSHARGTPQRGGGGAAVTYRPSVARYAVERHDSLVLDLAGAPQVQTFDRTAYLRVQVAEQAGAPLRVTVTLDSLVTPSGAPTASDTAHAMRGTHWTATLSPDGRISGLTGSDTTVVSRQLGSLVAVLFPRLPPGGATPGATWQDTVETQVQVNAFSALERAALTYTARGIESRGNTRALHVDSEGTFEQTGQGAPFGEKMEMKATGTRRATHYLGLDGVLVSAAGGDRGELTIAVPAVGQSVPAHQVSSYTVTALPAH